MKIPGQISVEINRLGKAGMIRSEKSSGETRWTIRVRIPGHDRMRLIVTDAVALQAGEDK